jgi:hypothetical protein
MVDVQRIIVDVVLFFCLDAPPTQGQTHPPQLSFELPPNVLTLKSTTGLIARAKRALMDGLHLVSMRAFFGEYI